MSFTIPFIISPSKTNVWSVTFHNDAASEGGIYERDCAHWDSTQELSHPLQFTALWHLFPDPFLLNLISVSGLKLLPLLISWKKHLKLLRIESCGHWQCLCGGNSSSAPAVMWLCVTDTGTWGWGHQQLMSTIFTTLKISTLIFQIMRNKKINKISTYRLKETLILSWRK